MYLKTMIQRSNLAVENNNIEDIKNTEELYNISNQLEETSEIQEDLLDTKEVIEELITKQAVSDTTVSDVERVAAEQLSLIGFKISEVCSESNYNALSNKEKLEIVLEQVNQGIKLTELASEGLWSDIKDKFVSLGRTITGNNKNLQQAVEAFVKKENVNAGKCAEIVEYRIKLYNDKVKGFLPLAVIPPVGKASSILSNIASSIDKLEEGSTKTANVIKKFTNMFKEKDLNGETIKNAWKLFVPVYGVVVLSQLIKNRDEKAHSFMNELSKTTDSKKALNIIKNIKSIKVDTNVKGVDFDVQQCKNIAKKLVEKEKQLENILISENDDHINFEALFDYYEQIRSEIPHQGAKEIIDLITFYKNSMLAHNELVYQMSQMFKDIAAKG